MYNCNYAEVIITITYYYKGIVGNGQELILKMKLKNIKGLNVFKTFLFHCMVQCS